MDKGVRMCCLCLQNNNHNEANKQQSLNFDENQAEQETESQIICYKGALYSKHVQYNPFCSWFLRDLCPFWCCACI